MGKLLLILSLLAAQTDRTPFTGKGVEGGSSQCNSGLRIYPRYIDWDTTHSDCIHTPYDVISSKPGEYVYRLKPHSGQCKFRVLVVRRNEDWQAWEAIGYSTEAAWRRNDSNDQLWCGPLF